MCTDCRLCRLGPTKSCACMSWQRCHRKYLSRKTLHLIFKIPAALSFNLMLNWSHVVNQIFIIHLQGYGGSGAYYRNAGCEVGIHTEWYTSPSQGYTRSHTQSHLGTVYRGESIYWHSGENLHVISVTSVPPYSSYTE